MDFETTFQEEFESEQYEELYQIKWVLFLFLLRQTNYDDTTYILMYREINTS